MCMRIHKCYMRVCARKRREGESDIGAADLNIEHARNITRRNLIATIDRRKQGERKRERERVKSTGSSQKCEMPQPRESNRR